ncbi:MAG TPA: signal peptide peptidase SppA [Bacteroidales bacterium]|nr:signal peptide peptidase SppA [Bacteroidales bacterium]HRW96011.1 signal peptide peptidase SppA [Bacteroidales bacterium]
MKQFLKYVLASMVGFFLMSVILFLLMTGMVASMASFMEKESVKVAENTVLHVKFDTEIRDRSLNDPFTSIDFTSMKPISPLGLNDILKNFEKASKDPNIKGIYLDLTTIQGGLSNLQEVRRALLDFKESGKFILAYSESFSQSAYYLASVADKIYLHPEGNLDFKGLMAEVMFFKGTLEKLDVDMQIIRHGKYKSAVEPFMLDKMSDENREQMNAMVKGAWAEILEGISTKRNIKKDELNRIADGLLIRSAEDALDLKFVDGLRYYDEVMKELKMLVGIEEDKDLALLKLSKYFDAPDPVKEKTDRSNKIAVVYAVGEIISGEGNDDIIGSDRIAKAIRDAREDSRVKAIVMRVNSPGGSALASDVILRETKLAAEEKPFIVSMGNVAASGGYYISAAAHKIFAEGSTITGSIGVLGMVPNLEATMKNKLGITIDYSASNANSGFITPFRPLTLQQREVIQSQIEDIYKTFVNHVVAGRGMTYEEVDAIGQGRVWIGSDARNIGLVDEIGGLKDAIKAAVELADLETYSVKELPARKDFFQELFDEITGNSALESRLRSELGENYRIYQQFKYWQNATGVQARMPFDIYLN